MGLLRCYWSAFQENINLPSFIKGEGWLRPLLNSLLLMPVHRWGMPDRKTRALQSLEYKEKQERKKFISLCENKRTKPASAWFAFKHLSESSCVQPDSNNKAPRFQLACHLFPSPSCPHLFRHASSPFRNPARLSGRFISSALNFKGNS